jgi:hypothetical protein
LIPEKIEKKIQNNYVKPLSIVRDLLIDFSFFNLLPITLSKMGNSPLQFWRGSIEGKI